MTMNFCHQIFIDTLGTFFIKRLASKLNVVIYDGQFVFQNLYVC